MNDAMTSRERIRRAVDHQEADRVAIQDAIWSTTEERWRREGLPEGASPATYFGFEMLRPGADSSFRFPVEVLEETEDYRIHRSANGRVVKDWKGRTSTPMLLGYAIENPDDWRKHRHRLALTPDRIDWQRFEASYREALAKGLYFCFTGGVGYQVITGWMHPDRLLEYMVTDPGWVKEMVDANTELTLGLLRMLVERGYRIDGYWCSDDLGYRNGLMFSPRHYRELIMPSHRKVCEFCHSHVIQTFLHSCGNVNEALDDLEAAGWDCLQPIEVKAGMDLVRLKRERGERLALMGGIDARVIAGGTDAELEEEVRSKIPIAMRGGGYLYHSDHSVPDDVSFARYQLLMNLVRRYGRFE